MRFDRAPPVASRGNSWAPSVGPPVFTLTTARPPGKGRAGALRPSGSGALRCLGLQHAAVDLVALHGLEQGLEIAFAEALAVVALALDELEEHGAQHGLGEDLQQQARLAALGRAVQQDAARLQLAHGLAVTGQAA